MTVGQSSKELHAIHELGDDIAVIVANDGFARLESYDRSNIGAQAYSHNDLGDRVRVVKPTGALHFVYDS